MFGNTKYNGYATFANGFRVYDKEVALLVRKHLRVVDRFNVQKIVEAALLGFCMLSGDVEIPKNKNWKF